MRASVRTTPCVRQAHSPGKHSSSENGLASTLAEPGVLTVLAASSRDQPMKFQTRRCSTQLLKAKSAKQRSRDKLPGPRSEGSNCKRRQTAQCKNCQPQSACRSIRSSRRGYYERILLRARYSRWCKNTCVILYCVLSRVSSFPPVPRQTKMLITGPKEEGGLQSRSAGITLDWV